ncbi:MULTISPECIES: hypothetical protein [Shewanella]|uniref:Uncharacterized protein n=1 Tax=Shewanella japonica TaxID=93973 RepID=A0ABN4YBL7_9GAMM|nr:MULTISPECIES: hypothetical protein [Shewanella]ARD21811.1 hypothetical protein SJ2017_1492 [Shewanella japonica]KPZ72813.1 hypothetical protein AN944_00502 [Shewanella sp. P1-14-1]MBQ4888393.1 hypothetical protein [Shewanella sp. MMG014]OBT09241.1 hypothetical protein A9267_09595 [Shewanella sp. UCD-FRSSP16_17]
MLFSTDQKLDIGNRWLGIFTKVSLGICAAVALMYWSYFYVSPSVTVKNSSEFVIDSAVIQLPHSRLDFGEINIGEQNRIYYDLAQLDGDYQYQLVLNSGETLDGRCGYVTNLEVNKRAVLTLNDNGKIRCDF